MSHLPPALLAGYRHFMEGRYSTESSRYRELAREGQAPETMVIACCDSRAASTTCSGASRASRRRPPPRGRSWAASAARPKPAIMAKAECLKETPSDPARGLRENGPGSKARRRRFGDVEETWLGRTSIPD